MEHVTFKNYSFPKEMRGYFHRIIQIVRTIAPENIRNWFSDVSGGKWNNGLKWVNQQ